MQKKKEGYVGHSQASTPVGGMTIYTDSCKEILGYLLG